MLNGVISHKHVYRQTHIKSGGKRGYFLKKKKTFLKVHVESTINLCTSLDPDNAHVCIWCSWQTATFFDCGRNLFVHRAIIFRGIPEWTAVGHLSPLKHLFLLIYFSLLIAIPKVLTGHFPTTSACV
jgi:hypothetical protein